MILLFTCKYDTHPSRVIDILDGWGVKIFRLNTEAIISDYNFSWWINENECDFYIENKVSRYRIYGSQITAIWDRRYASPSQLLHESTNDAINEYKLAEAAAFLSFLRYYLKDIFSIGSIVNDCIAESKFLQLAIAQKLGMRVPYTCVSNIKEELFDKLPIDKSICLKSLSGENVIDNNKQEYSLYTQRIERNILQQLNPTVFSETANFSQEYIGKVCELRVTVCCKDIVTCRIYSQHLSEENGLIDWRQGYDKGLNLEIIETPGYIRSFCLDFLKLLNLNFGCFDFIISENDTIFLECNPNGQWMWVEQMTNYDLSTIVAKNLAQYEL